VKKKLYATALKHLDSAKNTWEGPDDELAQLHNTIGYAYLQLGKMVEAIDEYKQAVAVQPGYVVAWNNLGDAYKRSKDYKNALEAYETTLRADAGNGVAREQAKFLRERLERMS